MNKKKLKRKKIIIDADYLLFQVCEGKFTKSGGFGVESGSVDGGEYKEPLGKYKERFKALANDVADEIAVAVLGVYEIKGDPKISLSDPDKNFRYKLQKDYKGNRDRGARSKTYYRLRKWAMKKYGYAKGCEADDETAYYVLNKGYIGASFDKDCLKGVEGCWFDVYYTRRSFHETSVRDAQNFNMLQNLMGDKDDNIRALPKKAGDPMIPCDLSKYGFARQPFKVTENIAIELLDEYGWNWDGIVAIFKSRGFGEKEALLTRRLTCLRQWHPKKGIKLWTK